MANELGRCGRVEPWITGWTWIKFADLPDPVKRPHLAYRHCPKPAVVQVEHDGFTFRWCAEHAASPTCGAPKSA